MLDSLPWNKTVKRLLGEIALVAAEQPKAGSGLGAMTPASAAPESKSAGSRAAVSQRGPGQPRKTVTEESQFIEDLLQRLKAKKGCEHLTKDMLRRVLQEQSRAKPTSCYDFLSGKLDPSSGMYQAIARVIADWKTDEGFLTLVQKLGAG